MFSGVVILAATAGANAQITRNLGGGWQVFIPDIDIIDIIRDDLVSSPTVLVLEKFATFKDFQALDLVFTQTAPNAQTVTRIILTDEYVFNLTGLDWSAFEITLTSQVPGNTAVFNPAASASLSILPFTTTTYAPGNQQVTYGGGTVPDGTFWTPGVATGAIVIDLALNPRGNSTFTLRERPIPSPAGASLLAVAGIVAAGRRRR